MVTHPKTSILLHSALTVGDPFIIQYLCNPVFPGTAHLEMLLLLSLYFSQRTSNLLSHLCSMAEGQFPKRMTPQKPQTCFVRGCRGAKAESGLLFPPRYSTMVLGRAGKKALGHLQPGAASVAFLLRLEMTLLHWLIPPSPALVRGVRSRGVGGISCIPVKGKDSTFSFAEKPSQQIWAK